MSTANKFVLAGVMGWPVSHSRSPTLHKQWIQHYGMTGSYVLLPVEPKNLPDAMRGLRVLGFAGCNITIPHKVAAMALVDRVDPMARRIGAINTVVASRTVVDRVNTDGLVISRACWMPSPIGVQMPGRSPSWGRAAQHAP